MQSLVTTDTAPDLNKLRVNIAPFAFSDKRIEVQAEAGASITELLGNYAVPDGIMVGVSVGGVLVNPEFWPHVRPKPGQIVSIRVLPMGGDDTNPLTTIFSIGLAIVAPGIGAFGAGALGFTAGTTAFAIAQGVIGGLVAFAGRALINSIVGSPSPRLGSVNNGFSRDPTVFGISGIKNTAPGASQPVLSIFGTHRIFPFFAAQPYTYTAGNVQILQTLFDLGYGPLQLGSQSLMKIGNRPISQFEGVQYSFDNGTPGTTSAVNYFTNQFSPVSLSQTLNEEDGWRTFTSAPDTDEMTIDITFQGLIEFDDEGNKKYRSVSMQAARRPDSTGSWLSDGIIGQSGATSVNLINLTYKDSTVVTGTAGADYQALITTRGTTTEAKYIAVEFKFATRGTHQIRIRRTTPDTDDSKIRDKAFITAVTSQTYQRPVLAKGRSLLAMRIRASGQLNGILDTFSCVVTRGVRTYTGSAWNTTYSYGNTARNPAWVFAEILRGQGLHNPPDDSLIDGAGLLDWANHCTTQDYKFDGIIDGRSSVWEVLKDVAAAGRASPTIRDGNIYSVVVDKVRTTPVDVLTPRDSLNFKGTRKFDEIPHAIRARYRDSSDDLYELKEIIVYNDGYSASTS
jgi:hypothetical protein